MLNDKIYYCNVTGQVLLEICNRINDIETTFDEDYKIYDSLSQRTKETICLKEVEFGSYMKLKKNCNVVRVNLDTLEFEFSYIEPQKEPSWSDEVDNKISILTEQNEQLKQQIEITNQALRTLLSEDQIQLLGL